MGILLSVVLGLAVGQITKHARHYAGQRPMYPRHNQQAGHQKALQDNCRKPFSSRQDVRNSQCCNSFMIHSLSITFPFLLM